MVWLTQVNSCKPCNIEQAKDTDRLGPNGTVAGTGSHHNPVVDIQSYRGKEKT